MKKGTFYNADIATLAAGGTYSTLKPALDVSRGKRIILQAYATGSNAGSSGTITFHVAALVGDHDPATGYSTSDLTTVTVDVAGTAAKVGIPVLIDCDGLTSLVLTSVVNGDAGYAVSLFNLSYGLIERDSETITQDETLKTGGA